MAPPRGLHLLDVGCGDHSKYSERYPSTRAGACRAPGLRRGGLQSQRVEGWDRLEEALQRQLPHLLQVDQSLDRARHTGSDEDLVALGLAAEAGRKVGDGADGAVVPASLEADGADGGVALGDSHTQGEIVAALLPGFDEVLDALAHGQRHAKGA